MAEDIESEETEEVEEASGGRKKLFLIAGVALGVLLVGGVGTFFVGFGEEAATEEEAADGEEEEFEELAEGDIVPPYPLAPLIVNVAEGQRDRYLKLRIELELTHPDVATELERRKPHINDLLISLLSAQKIEDLRTLEGKNALREEVQVRLNTLLRTGRAKRVFFTEFVIQ